MPSLCVCLFPTKCSYGYHDRWYKKKLYKRLFWSLVAFVLVVLFIIFIIWVVLRPAKPTFTLQQATIHQLNATSPTTLTTTFQISLLSHNPNDRIAIRYDRLRVYASYYGQQITLPTPLPPTFLGHDGVSLWSPFLHGDCVPVASFVFDTLSKDRTAGILPVDIKVDGKLRWKVGTWVSGHYGVYASCPAYVACDSTKGVLLQEPVGCSTDV